MITLQILHADLRYLSRGQQNNVDVSLRSYIIHPVSTNAVVRMTGGQFTHFVLEAHRLMGWQGWIIRESGDQGGDIYLIDPLDSPGKAPEEKCEYRRFSRCLCRTRYVSGPLRSYRHFLTLYSGD
jgi:hypothetical protein